jgi:predicted RNase H-like nuclease (RuvC/YqgF family)
LELLKEAEEREQQLKSEIMSLQTRLSSTQRERWQMANDCQQIKNFPAQFEAQAREVRRLEEMITDEEKKIESLEMKSRLVKRGKGAMDEEIRARCEEKLREIEALKQAIKAKDEQVSAAETRITDKNKTIVYLKEFLRKNGFRVAD